MRGLAFWQIFLIGFALVATGFVLAWLMVLRLIPTTFFLGLIAYGTSVLGLMVGVVGSAWHVAQRRRVKKAKHDSPFQEDPSPPDLTDV